MRGRLLCKYSNSIKKINLIFAKKITNSKSCFGKFVPNYASLRTVAKKLKFALSLEGISWNQFDTDADISSTIDLWKSWFHGIFWKKNVKANFRHFDTVEKYLQNSWKWWGLEFTKSFSKVVSNMNFLTRKVFVVISIIFPHHDVKKAIWRKKNKMTWNYFLW